MPALRYRDLCPRGDRKFSDWVTDLGKSSGAYIIKAEGGTVLYVGESHTGRLCGTLKRHFSSWKDDFRGNEWSGPQRIHFTYDRKSVVVAVVTCPPKSARGLQDNLIRRLHPRDNTNGYGESGPF